MTMMSVKLEEHQPLSSIVYDDNEQDDDEEEAATTKKRMSLKSAGKGSRRRRRSSARFLKLGDVAEHGDDDDGDDDNQEDKKSLSNKNLGEMYQKTIRMNAENRINASNSWNLSLIDHLDRFLTIPEDTSSNAPLDVDGSPGATVNFTKASCTLDASVKIYSYRVDDVHLTSYKVLANLNRTETGKEKDNHNGQAGTAEGGGNPNPSAAKKTVKPTHTETLEQNLGTYVFNEGMVASITIPIFVSFIHPFSHSFIHSFIHSLLSILL
jgi:condensin complex subunit 2